MILKQPAFIQRRSLFQNPFFEPDDTFIENCLKVSDINDPSMKSLAYIKMTSRKGLSCFQGKFADIIFSRHPNLDDTYIIYPSNIQDAHIDILELFQILRQTGNKVQVVRVPQFLEQKWVKFFNRPALEEQVLDYRFPVHLLDVDFSIRMSGQKFLKFRNKINAILKTKPVIKQITFSSSEVATMEQIVTQWAPLVFDNDFAKNTEYIRYALEKSRHLPNVRGLISYNNGLATGFTIWEIAMAGGDAANSLIHCCFHERGLSEYLHYEMMKSIQQDGIKYLSLGGAETQSLDAFKRKMCPISSVQLKTIHLA